MSNQPTSENKNDGLKLYNTYITTALKCVPPGDKPTPLELRTCFNYFKQEIDLLKNAKIIVALGKIAFDACIQFYKETYFLKNKDYLFAHAAKYQLPDNKINRFTSNYINNIPKRLRKVAKVFGISFNPNGSLMVVDHIDSSEFSENVTFLSGGGGLVSTTKDYLQFSKMILNKGKLNGKIMQEGNTSTMVFSIAELIVTR